MMTSAQQGRQSEELAGRHSLVTAFYRKKIFLFALTILVIANIIVWLDVFRGCTD